MRVRAYVYVCARAQGQMAYVGKNVSVLPPARSLVISPLIRRLFDAETHSLTHPLTHSLTHSLAQVAGLGEDGSFVMADSHVTNLMWRAVYLLQLL